MTDRDAGERNHGTREPAFDVGHPAPDRGKVSLWLLFFGLGGAALAWSAQIGTISALADLGCRGGPFQTGTGWGAMQWLLVAVNVAALIVGALALWAAFRSLHRTGREAGMGSRGVMDSGEGRTRYLAIWGVWTGVLFLIAIGFNTIATVWVGLCDA